MTVQRIQPKQVAHNFFSSVSLAGSCRACLLKEGVPRDERLRNIDLPIILSVQRRRNEHVLAVTFASC